MTPHRQSSRPSRPGQGNPTNRAGSQNRYVTITDSVSSSRSSRVISLPGPDPKFVEIFPLVDRPGQTAMQPQLPLDTQARIIPIRPRVPAPPIETTLSDAELDEAEFSRQPTRRESLPEPAPWIEKFAQGALEVMAGRRNGAQFARWTNRTVYFHLQHRNGLIEGAPRVHHVHICEPADGIAEATVTVRLGGRLRAVALRFEGLDGRWICTSLMLC